MSTTRHRYYTRSKAKRTKLLLQAQPHCPISLEPFTDDTVTFAHRDVKFDAFKLRDYLLAVPGASNPVNREPFFDSDLDELEQICKIQPRMPILRGSEALQAKSEQQQDTDNLNFFTEECKNCLIRFEQSFDCTSDDEYFNSVSIYRNALVEIMNDVLTMNNGEQRWKHILQELKEFAEQQMDIPRDVQCDVDDTFHYLLSRCTRRHATPPALIPWSQNTIDSDDDEDDDMSIASSPGQQLTPGPCPPYTRFSAAIDPLLIGDLYRYLNSGDQSQL